jgi:hypothetical protein
MSLKNETKQCPRLKPAQYVVTDRDQKMLPSSTSRTATEWMSDITTTIDTDKARNTTGTLTCCTLAHGGLSWRTGHLTWTGRFVHKRTPDCRSPTSVSRYPLDAFHDRTILMHGRENVLSAIGMPCVVVVERMRLDEKQEQASDYQEICSMPHRILLYTGCTVSEGRFYASTNRDKLSEPILVRITG